MKPLPPGTQAGEPSLLDQLHSCANQGWLRRLDSALAAFMLEQDPQAAPALLVSSAILAQMEGRGHTCLALRSIVTQPQELLAWPDLAQPALSRLWQHLPAELSGWLDGLRASPLVRCVGQQGLAGQTDAPDAGQPLVLGAVRPSPCSTCAAIGVTRPRSPVPCCSASQAAKAWTRHWPGTGWIVCLNLALNLGLNPLTKACPTR